MKSNKKMSEEIYQAMGHELQLWEEITIEALEKCDEKIRQESVKCLERICAKHGVSVDDWQVYIAYRIEQTKILGK